MSQRNLENRCYFGVLQVKHSNRRKQPVLINISHTNLGLITLLLKLLSARRHFATPLMA